MADFERLVDRIYDAATDPDRWPEVMRGLGDTVEAEATLRFGWAAGGEIASRLVAANRTGFVPDQEVFGVDGGWTLGATTAIGLPTGELMVVRVERWPGRAPLDRADIAHLDRFHPHLARAVQLAARWRRERLRAMAEALALIGLPAALLGPDGRLLAANRLIEALATCVVRPSDDHLAFLDRATSAQLTRAVAELGKPGAKGGCSFPARAADGGGAMVAQLVAVPAPASGVFDGGLIVLVLLAVTAPEAPSAGLIADLFDLTPAEARVACALAKGLTIDQIAAGHAVGYETVRSQVRAVFAKTGTSRQAAVASLLAGLPRMPLIPAPPPAPAADRPPGAASGERPRRPPPASPHRPAPGSAGSSNRDGSSAPPVPSPRREGGSAAGCRARR